MNVLYIFDFDDTLVRSDARVVIKSIDGSTRELSSEDYAKYTPTKGDIEDFSDFDSYPKNAEIIEPVFAELKSAISLSSPGNVVILTARSNPAPVRLFLKMNNVPPIDVVAVGSSDPMAKARYILDRLSSAQDIEEVIVFEDNVRNIRTIKRVVDKTGVKLQTNRVKNGAL